MDGRWGEGLGGLTENTKKRENQNSNYKVKLRKKSQQQQSLLHINAVPPLHACLGHQPLISKELRQVIYHHMKSKDDSSCQCHTELTMSRMVSAN